MMEYQHISSFGRLRSGWLVDSSGRSTKSYRTEENCYAKLKYKPREYHFVENQMAFTHLAENYISSNSYGRSKHLPN